MAQAIATVTTDADALQYLMQGPLTRQTTAVQLARTWGWNRMKVSRRLRLWEEEGRISREVDRNGMSTITVNIGTMNVAVHPAPIVLESQAFTAARRVFIPRITMQRVVALVLFALAITVAWFGLRINAWYGASLASDAQAAYLLAGLSVCADAVALLMPAVARTMSLRGARAEARAAWALWGLTMAVALLAAVGFAAVNISDSTAGRDKVASEAASLRAQIAQLQSERAAIKPSTAHGLRFYRAESARADRADAALAAARQRLAALPAVSTADPQGEMAAALLRWITGGLIVASAHDIAMARIIAMTLLPQISGLVLMLAAGLWRDRR